VTLWASQQIGCKKTRLCAARELSQGYNKPFSNLLKSHLDLICIGRENYLFNHILNRPSTTVRVTLQTRWNSCLGQAVRGLVCLNSLKLKSQDELEMKIYDCELFPMDLFCNLLLEPAGKNKLH